MTPLPIKIGPFALEELGIAINQNPFNPEFIYMNNHLTSFALN